MILHSDVFFFVVVVGLFSVGFFVCLFLLFVFFFNFSFELFRRVKRKGNSRNTSAEELKMFHSNKWSVVRK